MSIVNIIILLMMAMVDLVNTSITYFIVCLFSFVLFGIGIRAVVVDAGGASMISAGRFWKGCCRSGRWWSWIIPRIVHNISSTTLRHDWMSSDDRRVLWYAMAMIVGDVLRVSDIVLVTVSLASGRKRVCLLFAR